MLDLAANLQESRNIYKNPKSRSYGIIFYHYWADRAILILGGRYRFKCHIETYENVRKSISFYLHGRYIYQGTKVYNISLLICEELKLDQGVLVVKKYILQMTQSTYSGPTINID